MPAKLTDLEAHRRAELAGYTPDPDIPYPGATEPWPGTHHKCGGRVQPKLNSITGVSAQGPCGPCARKKISDSLRLTDSEARLRAELAGYTPDPNAPYLGINEPWPGTHHECGGRVQPRLGDLTHKNATGPCKTCASAKHPGKYSIKMALRNIDTWLTVPAVVYVISGYVEDELGDLVHCFKAGITTAARWPYRKNAHFRAGAISVVSVYETNLFEACFIEETILDHVEKPDNSISYSFPFDGAGTECYLDTENNREAVVDGAMIGIFLAADAMKQLESSLA